MTRDELIAAVPVHDHKGRPYFVVIDEIPQPWGAYFLDALYGSACPIFEGFGHCAYVWDWDVWVRGKWLGQGLQGHPPC